MAVSRLTRERTHSTEAVFLAHDRDRSEPCQYNFNVKVTKRVALVAHALDMSVEGEVDCLALRLNAGGGLTKSLGAIPQIGAIASLLLSLRLRCATGHDHLWVIPL